MKKDQKRKIVVVDAGVCLEKVVLSGLLLLVVICPFDKAADSFDWISVAFFGLLCIAPRVV